MRIPIAAGALPNQMGNASLSEKKALPDPKDVSMRILESEVARLKEEKHVSLVNEIVDLKVEHGILKAEDKQAQVERLKEISDEHLNLLKDDLQRMIRKLNDRLATRRKLYR